MKSISFSTGEFDWTLLYETNALIHQYRNYFYKVGKGDAEELMDDVLFHILTHYNADEGALLHYMLKLAKSMSKRSGREVPSDTVGTFISDKLDEEFKKDGFNLDFSENVINGLDTTQEQYVAVVELALGHMLFFNLLGKSLLSRDSTTRYFPDSFIKSCLTLSNRCGTVKFHQMVLDIYRKYKQKFEVFMGNGKTVGDWRELDKGLIEKNKSKRVLLVKKGTDELCEDPDVEEWEVKGVLRNKKIFKVPYLDMFNRVMDLVDEEGINPMKFSIGDSYICRSLGGSLSVVNVGLFREYEIFRLELLTNLIYDLDARHMVVGSSCIYMLSTPNEEGEFKTIPKRIIRGVPVEFTAIDVTPIQSSL